MSKKDFELIAKVLRDELGYTRETDDTVERETTERVIRNLAARFASNLTNTNPRFDRERFIGAATRVV